MDVSVIVPFYKGNKYISNILRMIKENAANAHDIAIELIIVNDSPNVEINYSKELVDGYDLSIVKHKKNMGIQQARITGIRAAQGTFLLMLDQDDTIKPNTIKKQFGLVGDNDAILSNGYSEDSKGIKTKLYKNNNQMSVVNDFSYYFYFGNMIASPGLCLIKKTKIPKLWMYKTLDINGADDWLLWVLYLNEGNRFVLNSECLYTHKNDGTNTSNNECKMLASSQEALDILKNEGIISKNSINIYERRLQMRREYYKKGRNTKILQYLKNLDICWYVFKYNKLM